MKSKRGISGVVATVLILMITVAAAGILVSFLLPFIKTNLDKSTECLDYKEYIKFSPELQYTCYDAGGLHGFSVRATTLKEDSANLQRQSNETTVTGNLSAISSGNNTELKGFSLVFVKKGDTRRVDVMNGAAASAAVGGVRLLDTSIPSIIIPRSGELQTYVYNAGSEKYEQIDLYPILYSGRICDKTDTIQLSLCKGVTLTP